MEAFYFIFNNNEIKREAFMINSSHDDEVNNIRGDII